MRSLTRSAKAHVDYLRGRLIPDLRESGRDATADDFVTCTENIDRLLAQRLPRRASAATKRHVAFLTDTLIPDLKESGYEFTAQDFEKCVSLIERLTAEKAKAKAPRRHRSK